MQSESISPTAFVVFGATGDLAHLKLYPALYELAREGALPPQFHLYGVARRAWTQTEFKKHIRESVAAHTKDRVDTQALKRLLAHTTYVSIDVSNPEGYARLNKLFDEGDDEVGEKMQRIFYLALPPALFRDVITHIKTCNPNGEARVMIEKPFGYDLASATHLSQEIARVFDESHVYRIDHYLGKEAVQNILTFRAANPFFEEQWNNKHIERIEIDAFEIASASGRATYYEAAGALRDMVQSHLLQILAYVTTDIPPAPIETNVRLYREKLLTCVKPFENPIHLVRGQYEGYRAEPGVAPNSDTETYVALTLGVATMRWHGVPMHIRTGKSLARKDTHVRVVFKDGGSLVFEISPRAAIVMNVKMQGGTEEPLEHVHSPTSSLGDYARLILDCLSGVQTLFVSSAEIRESWRVLEPYLQKSCEQKVVLYKPGSESL